MDVITITVTFHTSVNWGPALQAGIGNSGLGSQAMLKFSIRASLWAAAPGRFSWEAKSDSILGLSGLFGEGCR